MSINNFWELLAGLALYLYGSYELENSLKQLAGRTFKLFLRKHTNKKLNAILSGTVVTGILQSSSLVSVMVLSFVGAGIISMRNALAVVFGSNLGTTLDSWVVATLGFKLDIESFSLPIIALAGFGILIFTSRYKLLQISKFMMGFGLLFLGLGFMKNSMESVTHEINFADYAHLNMFGFLIIGLVVTSIIQSSSATMVLTLSALYAAQIPFDAAAAIIIGSELGTSFKLLLGSIGSIAAKKRVALGNIIFNVVITSIAFTFLHPIITLIKDGMTITEPLIGLVMFQTIINLIGVVLFFPFLNQFADLLEKFFTKKESSATYYISKIELDNNTNENEILEKESLLFINRVIYLNMDAFNLDKSIFNNNIDLKNILDKDHNKYRNYSDRYEHVKKAEGEILSFHAKLSNEKPESLIPERSLQLIDAVKNAMYSAKGIKDIRKDRKELRDSAEDTKYDHYTNLQKQLAAFYDQCYTVLQEKNQSAIITKLEELIIQLKVDYEERLNEIYSKLVKDELENLDTATLLNLNRELYSSRKAILISIKDFLLSPEITKEFDETIIRLLK